MRAFYDGDTFVALPGGFKWLDYLVCVVNRLSSSFVFLPFSIDSERDWMCRE
jgi:hypothetical protein